MVGIGIRADPTRIGQVTGNGFTPRRPSGLSIPPPLLVTSRVGVLDQAKLLGSEVGMMSACHGG
jgi:hypothetical protein